MGTGEVLDVLKSNVESVNARIDDAKSHVAERFDQVDKRFDQVDRRIDEVKADLAQRIDGVESGLGQRIDGLGLAMHDLQADLTRKIDELRDAIIEGRRLKLQGLALAVALAAASAVIGAFLLQLYAVLT